ncbi:hypothetical protein TNCV_5031081 [Trichonephila clavipes]|nr:hypothetical protein TNCV_5031081 [Trichonephila clavipes]
METVEILHCNVISVILPWPWPTNIHHHLGNNCSRFVGLGLGDWELPLFICERRQTLSYTFFAHLHQKLSNSGFFVVEAQERERRYRLTTTPVGYSLSPGHCRAGDHHPSWHGRRVGRPRQQPGQASGGTYTPKSHVRWNEKWLIEFMVVERQLLQACHDVCFRSVGDMGS